MIVSEIWAWEVQVEALENVRIKGDSIVADVVEDKSYDPLDLYTGRAAHPKGQKLPHLEFAGLRETTDHSAAKTFHEQYGAFHRESEASPYLNTYSLPVADFWEEQRRFAGLVRLRVLLKNRRGNAKAVRTLLTELVATDSQAPTTVGMISKYVLFPEGVPDETEGLPETDEEIPDFVLDLPQAEIWRLAEYYLSYRLNERLIDLPSRILPPTDGGPFVYQPAAGTLLDSMYVMLAYDAAGRREIAYCADPYCVSPFDRTRPNKKFCSRECANRVMVRRHYQRKNKKRRRSRLADA